MLLNSERPENGARLGEQFVYAEAARDDFLLIGELDHKFERGRDGVIADGAHVDGARRDGGLRLRLAEEFIERAHQIRAETQQIALHAQQMIDRQQAGLVMPRAASLRGVRDDRLDLRIVGQVGRTVYVDVLYPPTRGRRLTCQTVDAGTFQVTGTKGLVRIK